MKMRFLKYKMPRRSAASLVIVLGASLILCAMILLLQLDYARAQDTAEREQYRLSISPGVLFELGNMHPGDTVTRVLTIVNEGDLPLFLRVRHERVDGNPLPGEPGDLYAQMTMTITCGERVIYSGPLNGLAEPLDLSAQTGPIRPGQAHHLEVTVHLPGPETGNEFQGSTLRTRFVFHADRGEGIEVPPEEPGTDPNPPRCGSGCILLPILVLLAIIAYLAIKKRRSGRQDRLPDAVSELKRPDSP